MARHSVRACLIINPRSGKGGIDLSEAIAVLQAQDWDLTVQQKLHGGHATDLARAAVHDGYDVVVGCGGDGTLSEIVDGLVGTNVALGVLPGGTVNLWARELGVSRRLRVAAMQLAGAQRRQIDVGQVTVNGRRRRHFLLMAGLGIDGAVMARVSKPLKNRIGPLAVGLAALEAIPSVRAAPLEVLLDGVHWQGAVSQVVVGNTRLYGGFASITGGAHIDDGLLDVCLITAQGPIAAGRQIASLFLHHRPDSQSAETYRVASLTIRAPIVLPLQIDGGAVRLKKMIPPADGMIYSFSVVAQGVGALVPRTYDGALFMRDPLLEPIIRLPAEAGAVGLPGPDSAIASGAGGKKELRVIAIGANSLTAVRVDSGRVWTVLIGADTVLKDATGKETPLDGALSGLRVGEVVQVKGKKDREQHTIAARKVQLVT